MNLIRRSYSFLMITPLPVAEVLLIVAAGIFALTVASGIPIFVFYGLVSVLLAWQLVGKAAKG